MYRLAAWLWRKRPLGRLGESLAALHYRLHGYRVLERNARYAGCEIDLIVRRGDTTAFVEVKTRRRTGAITPEDSVGAAKQRHLRRAAGAYCARHDDPAMYYRFDILAVVLEPGRAPLLHRFENAFPGR